MFSHIAISGSAMISLPSRREFKNRPLLAIVIDFRTRLQISCLPVIWNYVIDIYTTSLSPNYHFCAQEIQKPGCCLGAQNGWQRSPSAGHLSGLWGIWWMLNNKESSDNIRLSLPLKIQKFIPPYSPHSTCHWPPCYFEPFERSQPHPCNTWMVWEISID